MISFNVPPLVGGEYEYVRQAIDSHKISGDGSFTQRCSRLLEKIAMGDRETKVLLTTSCTHALEMAALLCRIQPGDEVILPSYTFVSTADAFVQRGARLVFVDIRPDTMNIDETLLEDAITPRTKAIVAVHYAGVGCEMETINAVAAGHRLKVVEDAAQGMMATYRGQALGTLGDYGCYSFHETKNYSMGEGGAILLHDPDDARRAEIYREKGTNRSRFFRGEIDKYTWVDYGSSYLPSELNAAYLLAQLENADKINRFRLRVWDQYYQGLKPLENKERIVLPYIPQDCAHNAHMFYIKAKDLEERSRLIDFLKERDIQAVFHYVPLHSSPAGRRFGRFAGEDRYTTRESDRLLRLPMYYGLEDSDIQYVIEQIHQFYAGPSERQAVRIAEERAQ